MIKNIIFVCGAGGATTYVAELRKFCEQNGFKFYVPSLPKFADGITYDKYKISFEYTYKDLDLSKTAIICSSLGTNFIVKYMARNPLKIASYISVAGFSRKVDKDVSQETYQKLKLLDAFMPNLQEFKKFKSYRFPKYSIYGGKDCLFTIQNLETYADLIGAKKYYDKNGYHCTIKENVTKHELLHKVIEENFGHLV